MEVFIGVVWAVCFGIVLLGLVLEQIIKFCGLIGNRIQRRKGGG